MLNCISLLEMCFLWSLWPLKHLWLLAMSLSNGKICLLGEILPLENCLEAKKGSRLILLFLQQLQSSLLSWHLSPSHAAVPVPGFITRWCCWIISSQAQFGKSVRNSLMLSFSTLSRGLPCLVGCPVQHWAWNRIMG